eukprot:3681808-Lingulodinium_polyedra.AAC.1
MLCENGVRDAALLVLANKQDLPHAMTAEEVTEELRIRTVYGRQWLTQPVCATTGEGLYEGLDWLARTLQLRRQEHPTGW